MKTKWKWVHIRVEFMTEGISSSLLCSLYRILMVETATMPYCTCIDKKVKNPFGTPKIGQNFHDS